MVIDGIEILTAAPGDLLMLHRTAVKYKLDFDAAYQYMLAEKNQLQIISFDKDFDGTELGRNEPSELVH